MARFSGKIGFLIWTEKDPENAPGIWEEMCTEKHYSGDLLTRKVRLTNGESTATDISLNNIVSIVANRFAIDNIGFMKYVVYKGMKWAITDVTLDYPRIDISLGGLWNEPTT